MNITAETEGIFTFPPPICPIQAFGGVGLCPATLVSIYTQLIFYTQLMIQMLISQTHPELQFYSYLGIPLPSQVDM